MEAFLYEQQAGGSNFVRPARHYIEEFIYVLAGCLEIQLGETTYYLDPGDSIYFQGPQLRHMSAYGDEMLRMIAVSTPPVL
jgi:quercetin dioxygenase-like cupin family protein